MSLELVIIVFFGILLLMSNAFWFYKVNDLIDKIMSRNYGEYAQTKKYLAPEPIKEQPKEEMTVDPYDTQRANELNGILGLGS
jgi:hypothetical protein